VANERQQRAARAEQMRKEREKVERKQRNLISVAIVAVVIALIAVGGYAIHNTSKNNSPSGKYVSPPNLSDKTNFGFNYNAVDAGGKAGVKPVTVALYEDFQCPICKQFEEGAPGAFLAQQVKAGKITIQYRPFAFLNTSGNDHYSNRAASAGMCVYEQGGAAAYKKFHDVLYANQPDEGGSGLTDNVLVGYANQVGATGLKTCIKTNKYVPWVVKAKAKGSAEGVSGTPTVMINGKIINGATGANSVPQVADLQKAITAAAS
jgi:protein-disulfide isomerase